jgi:L-glutamine-phosphate cytidylyltransferase
MHEPIRTAVIVAAGFSSRLYPLTRERPKPLLEVDGEVPLLVRSVRALRARGVERIHVVVGYRHEALRAALGSEVHWIANPFFAHCNNLGSLWFARDAVAGEPFVYLHADLIYDPQLLDAMLTPIAGGARLLVEFGPADEEAMKVWVENGRFAESSKAIPAERTAGEWVGIATFSADAAAALFEEAGRVLLEGDLTAYDTVAFNRLAAQRGTSVELLPTGSLPWREIDDHDDLEAARAIFAHRTAVSEHATSAPAALAT